MPSYPPSRIRNVALVGHNGSGKTTLAEALLFATGAITRQGKVDDGSTVCDFEPEEVKRHMSLSLALAPCHCWATSSSTSSTPRATPTSSARCGPPARWSDLVVLVVSAVEGVEAQTEAAWELAAELGLPRLVFVNKLDRERASFDRTLAALRERFGAGIAPLELPVGEESGFRGIADLLTDTAIIYEGGKPQHRAHPRRPGRHRARGARAAGRGHRGRRRRPHGALPRRRDVPSSAELEATLATRRRPGPGLPRGVRLGRHRRRHRPAGHAAGRDRPQPRRRAHRSRCGPATRSRRWRATPAGQPLARVFKTISDPYVGKISLLRVLSGTIRPDTVLTNPRTHADERLHVLQLLRGKEAQPMDEAQAGDIVAVPKLADTATGDTLAPKGTPVVVPVAPPEPAVLSVAIRPKSEGRRGQAHDRPPPAAGGGPALWSSSGSTRRTRPSCRGTGETHLAVAAERLAPQVRRRGRHRGRARPLPGDHHDSRPRPKASTRSRPEATASSGWPRSASSPSSAARASTSSTRWWAVPSPGSTSRRSRRASSRPWARGASTATRWSTCRWPASTASSTPWTRRR